MVNLLNNVNQTTKAATGNYDGYVEPDTNPPPKAKPVLCDVSVNGILIPEADILAEAQHHPAESPGKALRAAAQALVVRELLLQEATRQNLNANSRTDTVGPAETEQDAAVRLLVEQEIHVPQSTESECRRYFDNNRHRFTSEPIYEARHILLPAAASDAVKRERAEAKAKNIITDLKNGTISFSEMAREFSACPSSQQGGNLGQLTSGTTVAEFEAALETMAEGELRPEPVATPFGFHVVELERKIDGVQLPFEQVKERIAAWLEAASWSRAVSQYVGILAGAAEIKGVELAVSDGPLVQ